MPEIENLKAKPYDELTMGEAIVIYLVDKEAGIDRIDYLTNKGNKKSFGLKK